MKLSTRTRLSLAIILLSGFFMLADAAVEFDKAAKEETEDSGEQIMPPTTNPKTEQKPESLPTAENPIIASSTKAPLKDRTFNPENVFDQKGGSYWCPKSGSKGEWISIYLGNSVELAGLTELTLTLRTGLYDEFMAYPYHMDNSQPDDVSEAKAVNIELWNDERLLATQTVNLSDGYYGTAKFSNMRKIEGVLWLRLILDENASAQESPCITEAITDLKGVDPNGARAFVTEFCHSVNMINKLEPARPNTTIMPDAKKLASYWMEYIDDPQNPHDEAKSCDPNGYQVLSSNRLQIYAREWPAPFSFNNNHWRFVE